MRHGWRPRAALDALKRVARNFNLIGSGMEAIDLKFYALRKDGEYAGASLWDKRLEAAVAQFAVCTGDRGSQSSNSVFLYERS